jgi:hypothetical protein
VLWAIQQHHLRDSAAERMADDIGAVNTRRLKPSLHDVRVPGQFVRGVGTPGQTVAWKVGHQHSPIAG